jgi:hypothetical protein
MAPFSIISFSTMKFSIMTKSMKTFSITKNVTLSIMAKTAVYDNSRALLC